MNDHLAKSLAMQCCIFMAGTIDTFRPCRLHFSLSFAFSSMRNGCPWLGWTLKSCAVTVALLMVIPFSALMCTLSRKIVVIGDSGRPMMTPASLAPVTFTLLMWMSWKRGVSLVTGCAVSCGVIFG